MHRRQAQTDTCKDAAVRTLRLLLGKPEPASCWKPQHHGSGGCGRHFASGRTWILH